MRIVRLPGPTSPFSLTFDPSFASGTTFRRSLSPSTRVLRLVRHVTQRLPLDGDSNANTHRRSRSMSPPPPIKPDPQNTATSADSQQTTEQSEQMKQHEQATKQTAGGSLDVRLRPFQTLFTPAEVAEAKEYVQENQPKADNKPSQTFLATAFKLRKEDLGGLDRWTLEQLQSNGICEQLLNLPEKSKNLGEFRNGPFRKWWDETPLPRLKAVDIPSHLRQHAMRYVWWKAKAAIRGYGRTTWGMGIKDEMTLETNNRESRVTSVESTLSSRKRQVNKATMRAFNLDVSGLTTVETLPTHAEMNLRVILRKTGKGKDLPLTSILNHLGYARLENHPDKKLTFKHFDMNALHRAIRKKFQFPDNGSIHDIRGCEVQDEYDLHAAINSAAHRKLACVPLYLSHPDFGK